jgi:hypothetical protein
MSKIWPGMPGHYKANPFVVAAPCDFFAAVKVFSHLRDGGMDTPTRLS